MNYNHNPKVVKCSCEQVTVKFTYLLCSCTKYFYLRIITMTECLSIEGCKNLNQCNHCSQSEERKVIKESVRDES